MDGNTNGSLSAGYVSATNSEAGAWWQVDLGEEYAIAEVDIWNTTDDCCKGRPGDYWVKVSNTGADWEDPPWKIEYHSRPGDPRR